MEPAISEKFNTIDADLIIQSSTTSRFFLLQKRNVAFNSKILAMASDLPSPTLPYYSAGVSSMIALVDSLLDGLSLDSDSDPINSFLSPAPSSVTTLVSTPLPTPKGELNGSPKLSDATLIVVPETASTLELLFQYMYPQAQPDISELDFDVLLALAEAAEKYFVYSALEVCRAYLSIAIPEHPLPVLLFGLKHKKPTLIDKAAKYTVGIPIEQIVSVLQPKQFIAWVKYHRLWIEILNNIYSFREPSLRHWEGCPKPDPASTEGASATTTSTTNANANNANDPSGGGGSNNPDAPIAPTTRLMINPCEVWTELYAHMVSILKARPEVLASERAVEEVFREVKDLLGLRCRACERLVGEWQAEIEWQVAKVEKFTSVLLVE